MTRDAFTFADQEIAPGRRARFELPVARLPSGTWMSLPVTVLHGRHEGPTLWISSGVHGDELNGIEIIRRLLQQIDVRVLHGTVITVPVVNVFGLVNASRYLPDLNRSFPGSPRGSLASRLAHRFMTTIVARCSVGLDLHTGSDHRENLPQIRADLHDAPTRELATAFAPPIMLHARLRDGSLREAAAARGARVLLYEGGEALRFSDHAITAGEHGALRLLQALRMCPNASPAGPPSLESHRSAWVRARRAGILRTTVGLGDRVARGDPLARIADPDGSDETVLRARSDGLVIGLTNNPIVSQGDAVFHVAELTPTP